MPLILSVYTSLYAGHHRLNCLYGRAVMDLADLHNEKYCTWIIEKQQGIGGLRQSNGSYAASTPENVFITPSNFIQAHNDETKARWRLISIPVLNIVLQQ